MARIVNTTPASAIIIVIAATDTMNITASRVVQMHLATKTEHVNVFQTGKAVIIVTYTAEHVTHDALVQLPYLIVLDHTLTSA